MFKITLDSATLGKGEKVTIAGVGELENGETVTFPDEVDLTFRQANATIVFDKSETAVVKLGRTLRSSFRKHPTIKVEYYKEGSDKPLDEIADDEEDNANAADSADVSDNGDVNA